MSVPPMNPRFTETYLRDTRRDATSDPVGLWDGGWHPTTLG